MEVRTGFYLQSQLQYCIQLWGPQHRKDMKLEQVLENDQRTGTHCLWGQAERAAVVRPGEQKAPGRPSCGLLILKGGFQERLRCFNRACSDRTKGNYSFELKGGRFRLNIKKKFAMVRVVKYGNTLPREAVDATPLETFKACQMGLWASSSSRRCPWPWQEGWTRSLKVASNSNNSMVP